MGALSPLRYKSTVARKESPNELTQEQYERIHWKAVEVSLLPTKPYVSGTIYVCRSSAISRDLLSTKYELVKKEKADNIILNKAWYNRNLYNCLNRNKKFHREEELDFILANREKICYIDFNEILTGTISYQAAIFMMESIHQTHGTCAAVVEPIEFCDLRSFEAKVAIAIFLKKIEYWELPRQNLNRFKIIKNKLASVKKISLPMTLPNWHNLEYVPHTVNALPF
jgi:hypothetical protein